MAVTITVDDLENATDASTEEATRLLPVCSAIVTRYASGAPDAIHNEAVIRLAGYLRNQTPGLQVEKIGDLGVIQPSNQSLMLRHSGASGLLTPFRVRTCGPIG